MSVQLNRAIPFVDAICRIREGKAHEIEAVGLLLQAEQKHGVMLVRPAVEGLLDAPENLYHAFIEGNFFSFLTETNLVLSHASAYDEITLFLPGGYTWSATWRAWGATLADWANQAAWGGKTDWQYMDFYVGYPLDHFRDFEPWQDVVLRVIEAKCKRADTKMSA